MPPDDADQLRQQVDQFLATISAHAASDPFVDLDTARRIAATLGRAIDAWAALDDTARARVAQVVTYVVTADDEEHDLLSPIGLVDDEEQVTQLTRELGL